MGKRSNFERNERDYYKTPLKGVQALIPHLPDRFTYWEPCAGDGALIRHINDLTDCNGRVIQPIDIEPQCEGIEKGDIFENACPPQVDYIITNPPWDRKFLHPMIERCAAIRPTWLLFDADWMHTVQSSDYMKYCTKVVSVGRLKWIEGTNNTGKDNCAWYQFDSSLKTPDTIFIGR